MTSHKTWLPAAETECKDCGQRIHEDGRSRTGWRHDTDALHCDRARPKAALQ